MNDSGSSIDSAPGDLVAKCLEGLARERPIFHSEADFQHAFAWHIRKTTPVRQVRLEFKPFHCKNLYLDIWLPDINVAIELKYKTRKLKQAHGGEFFRLREQSAQDCGRYDFLQDVSRLERLVKHTSSPTNVGLAVFLTNDSLYWRDPRSQETIDCNFRIHEGRKINGNLEWHKPFPEWKPPNRKEPILLSGTYGLNWRDYHSFGTGKADLFRYLLVKVVPPADLETTGCSHDW